VTSGAVTEGALGTCSWEAGQALVDTEMLRHVPVSENLHLKKISAGGGRLSCRWTTGSCSPRFLLVEL
jgi:hypothetical protein